jgi:Icc-related predicted phosphoesterase
MHTQEKAVSSLLFKFQKHGFKICGVNDGEESFSFADADNRLYVRKKVTDIICSVDESWVKIQNNQGERATLLIVLGNDDSEILCDYSWSSKELMQSIELVAEEFYQQWEKV